MKNTEDFTWVLLFCSMGLILVMIISLLFSLPCQGPYIIKFELSGQLPTTFKESGQLPIETGKNDNWDWDWDNDGKKKSEKESDKKGKVVPAPAYLFCPPSI